MVKFFVTGASGMLGTTLYSLFTSLSHTVISTDINPLDPWCIKLDIRDKLELARLIKRHKPDVVLNFAALTDVEYCELNQSETFSTNGSGVRNVAEVCRELSILMVHISTAGVFDGTRATPYTEYDTPNPINVYGKAKYAGDLAVCELLDKYFIFRAGWMMGSGDRDKKFVRKVLNLIDKGQKVIYGLTDVYGCPTYTLDFAKGILKMVTESTDYGLYHMVSEGNCTRYDVAKKIVEVLGFDDVRVEQVQGDFFKQEFFAPRPVFEVAENRKYHEKNLKIMRQWDEAATDYLNTYFAHKYGKNRYQGSV